MGDLGERMSRATEPIDTAVLASASSIRKASELRDRHVRAFVGASLAVVLVVAGVAAVPALRHKAGTTTGPSTGVGSQVGNGITGSSVKLGITYVDLKSVAEETGFTQEDYGDVKAEIQAIVDYVNAHGGAGGRQIQPDIREYQAVDDSPEFETKFCATYTQDDQDFAVVLDGAFDDQARDCYQHANTLMIDDTLVAEDKQAFQQYAPYLWSPSIPSYDSFVKAQLETMQAQGFFNGSTGVSLGVVQTLAVDRVLTDVVEPTLTAMGQKYVVTDVSQTGISSLNEGAVATLTKAQQNGYNRILAVGGARLLSLILGNTQAAQFSYKVGISTFDNPAFFPDNPGTEVLAGLDGALGLSFSPSSDLNVQSELSPFPNTELPGEATCVNIVKPVADFNPLTTPNPDRGNYAEAMKYCDAIMFFKAVMDQAPNGVALSPLQFQEAEQHIGSTYTSAVNFAGAQMEPGQYAISVNARSLAYNATCPNDPGLTVEKQSVGCFTLGSTPIPVPADVGKP